MKKITTQRGTKKNQEESTTKNQRRKNTIKIMNQEELGRTKSHEPKEDEFDQYHDSKNHQELGAKNQRRMNTIKITNQEVDDDKHDQGHKPINTRKNQKLK